MTRYRVCNILLLFVAELTLSFASTDYVYSVVRQNGIKPRSISATDADARTQSVPLIDDNVMEAMVRALDVINTPDCLRDFNATIIGIQQRQPWAVASMYIMRDLDKKFCIF